VVRAEALGGAAAVLATVTDAEAIAGTAAGLRPRGRLVVVGVPEQPLALDAVNLILGSRTVAGHASGTSKDSEDALRFAALTGVRPMIEEAPMEEAQHAFDAMMAGRPRFRMVLTA